MMKEMGYLDLVAYCESFLERHGDTHLGVGWTKEKETADERYKVMLGVIRPGPGAVSLLDFGCGASHLYEYITKHNISSIRYSGLDLSTKFLELSRSKFPNIDYYQIDILRDAALLPEFDYIVLNGIFNSKCRFSFEEMLSYVREVVRSVFQKARVGIAFNVVSKHVDWERDDLFHLPFDLMASFVAANLSRDFIIRHDYGLYEYTVYLYKPPAPRG